MTIESPLTQALPTSLEELFNRDPDTFSGPDDPDLLIMVRALRADRARWDLSKKKKQSAPKKEAAGNLSLGDLDL